MSGHTRDTGPIGVGIVGLGFMGPQHLRAYRAAADAGLPCRVAAVCDRNPDRLTGRATGGGNLDGPDRGERLFDPARVAVYREIDELLGDDRVELVSICTHTDSHVALAERALQAGRHVLVEKPVAIASSDIRGLARIAGDSRRLCMPAMCMRFWPAWRWLRDAIVGGRLGAVRSASFHRLGAMPDWARGFYDDPARSGGALIDLHIHDADFVRWVFGPPTRVTTLGTPMHATTRYEFAAGPGRVDAEFAWDRDAGFVMRYRVECERGAVDFELGRSPELIVTGDGTSQPVPLEAISGYDGQVRHLVGVIAAGGRTLDATLDEAAGVADLLAAERQSLASGSSVELAEA